MSRFTPPPKPLPKLFDSKSPYDLIVIAASAGGLAALTQVLKGLPRTLDVPIVIVQHRGVSKPSLLPAILARSTELQVKEAQEGELVLRGHVYIAPPDRHLVLRPGRRLRYTDGTRIKHVLSSANPLFESAARVLKNRVIAIVLTGSGTDATDGVQTVKRMGGVVIAQNPAQAEHPAMPTSAIESGAVDYVASLEEIPQLLLRLTHDNHSPEVPDPAST